MTLIRVINVKPFNPERKVGLKWMLRGRSWIWSGNIFLFGLGLSLNYSTSWLLRKPFVPLCQIFYLSSRSKSTQAQADEHIGQMDISKKLLTVLSNQKL